MKQIPLVSLLLIVVSCGPARAEVPQMTPDELQSESSHIVIGTVRAVYSTFEKSKNWQETSSIAEISVMTIPKGTGLNVGDGVYAHFWNKKWIGEGNPEFEIVLMINISDAGVRSMEEEHRRRGCC